MDFSLIIENSDSLFDRYKDLSLMELGLFLWDLAEYYENDFKEVEASELIFRTLKLLFIKAYCKHFEIANGFDTEFFLKTFILGQVTM